MGSCSLCIMSKAQLSSLILNIRALPHSDTPSLATGKSRQNESEDPPEAVTARDATNARHHSAAGLVESRGGGVGLQQWDRGGREQERGALFRDTNHCAMCA